MAVGRIGSYPVNSYQSYTSTISQLRLQQALQNNQRYPRAVSPVRPVSDAYGSSSMDFLKQYNSSMSDLMQSANALRGVNASGVMKDLTVNSSASSVASAEERYRIRDAVSLELEVQQTARAQVNESSQAEAAAKASGDMDFSVTAQRAFGGSSAVQVQVSALREDGSVRTNREMLAEAAAQINEAGTDVRAQVIEKDGNVSLRLERTATGAENTFAVTGALGSAQGLSDTVQAARDARYTVTKDGETRSYTSADNEITLDGGRIQAKLQSEGRTVISAQADGEKTASAVEELVNSYNRALKVLNDNADRGPGVMNQLRNLVRGLGSEEELSQAGISVNKDGTLELDKETLQKNLQKNPGFVEDILSGRNGIAQTAFDKGAGGLRVSADSLLKHDLEQMEIDRMTDSYYMMHTFSKTGAYNLNNYYSLGLMIDYLI